MDENINISKEKAKENALKIENSLADYFKNNLNNTVLLDDIIQQIAENLVDKIPDMNINEQISTLRTLANIKNNTAKTLLDTITTESSNNILTQLRDREIGEDTNYTELFQSQKNKPADVGVGLIKLNQLLKSINDKNEESDDI